MTAPVPGCVIDRAIAAIDARQAFTGPIATTYAARIQTPDGRWWSLRLTPFTQGEDQ